MVVRLVYSLIFEATGNRTFNSSKGDPTAYLLMTYLPELGIIATCTATIMGIPSIAMKKELEEGVTTEESHDGSITEAGSHRSLIPMRP